MDESPITPSQLAQLEEAVVAGLRAGDPSGLSILGFGELSMALGWPIDEPELVCKRTPPFTSAQFEQYKLVVTDYVARLRAAGIDVVDTTILHLERDGRVIGYLVQPRLPAATLGHRVLAGAQPDPDHPFLVAVADSLDIVNPSLSLDAQVTNFSWDGTRLTLIDVGTPFLWEDDGGLRFDMTPFLQMIPAPTRPLVKRDMTKVVTRWREPRRVGLDIVANLYRQGLNEWVEPTVTALNRRWPDGPPITAAEARAFYDEDVKTWPRLKRLQAVERWWRMSVRRQDYDFFIFSTFGDDAG